MESKTNLKRVCRLCAMNNEFFKDLLDDNNVNLLNLIEEHVAIKVSSSDNLPKTICLNCEEKVMSFHLFVLECYKAQDLLVETEEKVKNEEYIELDDNEVKHEIKNEQLELKEEDIASAIGVHNEAFIFEDDDEDEFLDNVAIATLKKTKKKADVNRNERNEMQTKPTAVTEELLPLNEVLKKSYIKVKDLIRYKCEVCQEVTNNWSDLRAHCFRAHKCKAVARCVCGFAVKSKSVLYKHVARHRLESIKIHCDATGDNDRYANLNVSDFVTFVCKRCEKKCSSWYSLKAHSEKYHQCLPVVNCICGIILKSKSVLYKHVNDHKNPNVLSCDKCPRIARTVEALEKHKMRHVPKSDRKYCCGSCDKVFPTKDALKSHEKSHIPIEERKIYECDRCGFKFTTRSSAASHRRIVHEKIKSFICDLCGYSCGTSGELRQHRAIHSDEKPFVCNKCSKPFKTYSNLKTHMDTHDDTSYTCYVCSRVLNSRRTLRKHLLVHEDKCKHICSYCNKAFKRRQTLKVHMYTHTGDKPLSCKWCDERFSYASTLRSHRLRYHPEKIGRQPSHYTALYTHTANNSNEYLKGGMPVAGTSLSKHEEEIQISEAL